MPATPTDHSSGPPVYLLPLLQFADSALPTGAFSQSYGLETYITEGVVHDRDTFAAWLDAYVRDQLAHTDALAAHLVAATSGEDTVWLVDQLLHAQALAREVREATRQAGRRAVAIACAGHPSGTLLRYRSRILDGRASGHPAVATALVGRQCEAPPSVVVAVVLHAAVTSLTQNAVRAVPLGQDAGQSVLAGIHQRLAATCERVAGLGPESLGAVAPGLEIAQMRHERQRARMFMS